MVDLKSEEGRRLARQLVLRSDLLIENFRPGVTDRLGLNYDELKKETPGLVYLSIKGFGEDGPYRDQPAYDQVIQGLVGFMAIQGAGGSPEPIRNPMADKVSAMSAAMSALAALWARERNGGVGQKVVVKMLDAWAAFVSQDELKNHPSWTGGPAAAVAPDVQSFRYPGWQSHRTDHSGPSVPRHLRRRRPSRSADGSSFAKPGDRLRNIGELHDELAPSIARLTSAAFLEGTRKHGVPMAPVNTLEKFFEDPQAKHNKTFPVFADAEFGDSHTRLLRRVRPDAGCIGGRAPRSSASTPTKYSGTRASPTRRSHACGGPAS